MRKPDLPRLFRTYWTQIIDIITDVASLYYQNSFLFWQNSSLPFFLVNIYIIWITTADEILTSPILKPRSFHFSECYALPLQSKIFSKHNDYSLRFLLSILSLSHPSITPCFCCALENCNLLVCLFHFNLIYPPSPHSSTNEKSAAREDILVMTAWLIFWLKQLRIKRKAKQFE